MAAKVFYLLQPAFTTGEVSPEVAARVDINKYQSALLKAENAIIRPYGGVFRRMGSRFCAKAKYDGKKSVLMRFSFSDEVTYVLEFGEEYCRVHKFGVYLGVQIQTPFAEEDLPNLRFTQSADVLYVCSRRRPVQVISRYREDDWRIEEFKMNIPPFESINLDEENLLTPSGKTGNISLSSSKDVFTPEDVGAYMRIEHEAAARIITTLETPAEGLSWQIVTRGTWTGTLSIKKSEDGVTWEDYREYRANNDYNASDNGVFSEPTYVKATGSSINFVLTVNAYTHEGIVRIQMVSDAASAQAEVIKPLYAATESANWYWGAFSYRLGFPFCATFFQDRLVFAGSFKSPSTLWFSRTGDYTNFGVETAGADVLDDSAITAPLLSREAFDIRHIVAGTDLIIFTSGNEWLISGSEVVSPTNITPKMQTSRGASIVEPQYIGNRIVYVQRRGSTVRDLGYSYESDNYTGLDLTLLAKHLIAGREITDATYSQEPDSVIYFTASDGSMLCLTYLREQEVYAWSRFVTDGAYESVLCVPEGGKDVIYVLVRRQVCASAVRYIERFVYPSLSEEPTEHVKVDSALKFSYPAPTDVITGLSHLSGKMVQVTADRYLFPLDGLFMVGEDGTLALPEKVNTAVVGLPYAMELETTNVEIQLNDGTIQGRLKNVTAVTLMMTLSYGGRVGLKGLEDSVLFEETDALSGDFRLFSGNRKVTLAQDQNEYGRVVIRHEEPYPFSLTGIVREVAVGGL
jgi:hypothetical protein